MPLYVKNKNRKTVLTSLIFALAIGMSVTGWFNLRPVFAQAITPSINQINISASLFGSDNRVISNGTYEVRFAIYTKNRQTSDPYPSNTDAGSRLWEETQTVTVKNGIFRALLGAKTPFPKTLNFENGDYYVGMRIGTDSEMIPRKQLGSVPSAVNSQFLQGKQIGTAAGDIVTYGNGGKIDIKTLPTGKNKNQLVLGNDARLQPDPNSHAQNTDTGTDSNTFNIGSGTGVSGNNFDLKVSSASVAPALRYSGATGAWQFSNDGSTFTDIPGSSSTSVDILLSADGTTGTTSSFSGLEFAGGGTSLSLLQGCANGQALGWNSGTKEWECTSYSAGLGGSGMGGEIAIWSGVGISSSLGSEARVTAGQGGTGIDTSASTGVPTISSGTWSVAAQLSPLRGGTGINGSSAANGTLLIGNGTGYTLSPMSGDATISSAGVLAIGADAVALATDTTGNYVATLAAGNGISTTGAASGENISHAVSVNLLNAADGTGATSSRSGLEFQGASNNQLTLLQGCANKGVLSWNSGTSVWECDTVSGVGGLSGSGSTNQVAYWSGTGSLAGENQLAISRGGTNASTASGARSNLGAAASGPNSDITALVGLNTQNGISLNPYGVSSGETGEIRFLSTSGSNYVGFKAPDSIGTNKIWTLPASDGSSNQLLATNGSGALSWISVSGAGGITGSGTSGQVTFWNGTNSLTGENQLSPSRGGTGINTSASSGVMTVSGGTWSASSQLSPLRGGTGVDGSSAASGTLLIGNGTGYTLAAMSSDATISSAGVLTIAANAVALATDTTGNYVATLAAGNGISTTGAASGENIGHTVAVNLLNAVDATGATSSNSGLEFQGASNNQLTLLQGCTSGQGLKWNSGTSTWDCGDFAAGITGSGTNGQITYWTGGSSLGSEAYVTVAQGGTGQTSYTDGELLIGNSTGNTLTKSTLTAGNGVAVTNGNGSIALDVSILSSADTSGAASSSVSGLAFRGVSNQLTLLQGCANGELLKWSSGSGVWACSSDVGGVSSAVVTVAEDGTEYSGISKLQFDPTDFSIYAPTSTAEVTIDYINSKIVRSNQAEVVTSGWTFSGGLSVLEGGTSPTYKTTFQGGDQSGNITYTLPIATGSAGQVLKTDASNNLYWATVSGGSGGIGTVTSVATGNGLTGGPVTETGTISINLLGSAYSTVTTSSASGLEFSGAGGNQLTLLQGCSSGNVLSWDGSAWACNTVGGLGGGSITAVGDVSSGSAFTASGTAGTSLYFYDVDGRGQLTIANLTAPRTYTLPDVSGNIVTTGDTATVTNTMLSGSIAASKLVGTDITTVGTITSGIWHSSAVGAQYGGTGINTSGATGVPYIVAGAWNTETQLSVSRGGTGAGTFASHGVLYGNTTSAIGATSAGTDGQLLLGVTSGAPAFATMSGDVSITNAGVTTIAANAVALGTDTTGDYVASISAGNGISTTGASSGENISHTLSINLLSPAFASVTTSSASGLEFSGASGNQLTMLQGCTTNDLLKWNGSVWACSPASGAGLGGDITGVGDVSSGEAFTAAGTGANLYFHNSGYSGQLTVATFTAGHTYTLPDVTGNIVTTGDTGTVTNTMLAGSIAASKLVNDSIGDTQLAFNTGQNLTTASSPSFTGLTVSGLPSSGVVINTSGALSSEAQLAVVRGGTGAATASGARTNLGAAASGANTDITALTGLNAQNAISLSPYNTSAGNTGEMRFLELAANGTNYVGFKAPDAIGVANPIWTLPAADGSSNQLLATNGSGTLSWINVSGAGGITGSSTSGYVTIWGSSSTLSGEAQLATSRGGTGVNGSAAANGSLLIGNGAGYTLSTMSGDATIASSGAFTIANNAVTGGKIASNTILASNLLAGAATNGYMAAYNSGTGGFTWVSPSSVGAGDISAVGDVLAGDAFTAAGTGASLYFHSSSYLGQLTVATLTNDRVYTLPDATGTVITTGNLTGITATGTIASGTWNGTAIGTTHGGTGTTTAFTQGSVVFAGASGVYNQDNTSLFFDDTNNRLGIGTTTPTTALEVVGDITSKGTSWTARTSPGAAAWFSVAYGNGTFVATASGATAATNVMTSPDGINWTSRTSTGIDSWYSVTYGNGLFVAVSGTGAIMTSPNGINWTSRTSPSARAWQSVTYGNGLFVAVAQDGTTANDIMTSPDGINWTSRTSPAASPWFSVTYGNGLFVAVAAGGTTANQIMTSPDGITWTLQTSQVANMWESVTYGNGLFVAVSRSLATTADAVMTSPDGINWTSRTAPSATWQSVTYGNGLFVAVYYNVIMTSPDGINWTARTVPNTKSWSAITYGNGIFVAVAGDGTTNSVMTSGKTETTALAVNNIYNSLVSTSATADTQFSMKLSVTDTGIVTTGTDTTYGSLLSVARTGATGGTINNYGQYIDVTADNAGAGTSTNYGLYVNVTGADTNYAGIFMGGNVGIGTATPTSLFSVGSSSQFQVNSSGVIAATAGLTLSALGYVDLGAAVHGTTAIQGLRLPQAASATPSSPTSGEGYLAWDVAGNQLITYNGSSWVTVGGGDLQTSYGLDADGSDATISLTTADDSVIISNPTSAGTDSAFAFKINQQNTTAAVSAMDIIQASNAANGINVTANAIDTESAMAITATGLTSGYAQTINVNAATTLTTGGGLKIVGPTGAATMNATTGLLNITSTGAITNTTAGAASGSLFQVNGNGAITPTLASISDTSIMTTTGKLLDLTANAATTTTGLLTVNATGLTSGYAQKIAVSGTTTMTTGGAIDIDGPTGAATMNATTGLVNISSTGAITNTTAGAASGTLFQITGNGAITPTLASISDTSVMTTTGKLLDLTANAATTTTGLLTMNADGLTSGSAQAINSASTALTGSLQKIALTGSNAANTGNLLLIADSGALNTSTPFKVTGAGAAGQTVALISNNGSGTSFRVDDVTSDTTPFVIDASGNVGIGMTAPTAMLEIYGTSNALKLTYSSSPNYSGTLSATSIGDISLAASNTTEAAVIVGTGSASQDVSVQFDSNTNDFFVGTDVTTGSFMMGSGLVVQAGSAYFTMTSAGLMTLTGSALTTTNLLTLSTAALTTGYAETINVNGAAVLTTGGAINIDGPTGAATMNATTGLVNISSTGAITNTTAGAASGTLFQVTGNGAITPTLASISDTSVMTTTGKLLDLTANAATTTTGLLTMNATGLTTGYAQAINVNGTTTMTTGGAINIDGPTGAATMNATTGLVNISSTGAITNTTAGAASGTLFQVTGNGAITPTLASISDTSVMTTTGKLLDLTANAATTTTGLLTINADGLTTGRAVNISSASAALTGSIAEITLSGSNAANTGSLLTLTNSGTANANTTLTIQHNATGTNNLAFRVNDVASDTTPFVIDGAGNVGIGKAAPTVPLDVVASGTGTIASFVSSNSTGCTLADGGTITCTSDVRLKKNIVSMENSLAVLMSLRPVEYNWKSQSDGETKSFGFIAQEVESVLPRLVITDNNGYKELNTIGLVPIIAQAVQEQQAQIADISLKTDTNITTLAQLQASVDTQLTVVGTKLNEITAKDAEYETYFANDLAHLTAHDAQFVTDEGRLTALDTLTSQMQLDMNTQASKLTLLETQMQSLVDFYTAFDLGHLVAKDAEGNIDLTVDTSGNPLLLGGKLKATVLETGALAIDVVDPLAPTIGTAVITPVETDVNADGIDDITGSDGMSIVVSTKAMIPMVKGSRIFTNFKNNPNAFSWIEKVQDDNKDYVGFKVRLSAPVVTPVKVDWLLVEQKDGQ